MTQDVVLECQMNAIFDPNTGRSVPHSRRKPDPIDENTQRTIDFVLVPGFSMLSLSAATEPLRRANSLARHTVFAGGFSRGPVRGRDPSLGPGEHGHKHAIRPVSCLRKRKSPAEHPRRSSGSYQNAMAQRGRCRRYLFRRLRPRRRGDPVGTPLHTSLGTSHRVHRALTRACAKRRGVLHGPTHFHLRRRVRGR